MKNSKEILPNTLEGLNALYSFLETEVHDGFVWGINPKLIKDAMGILSEVLGVGVVLDGTDSETFIASLALPLAKANAINQSISEEINMEEHFNKLTPAEAERLSILLEEMGEAIQIIGKIQRHGYASHHPEGGPNNRVLLEVELGHVIFAYKLMIARTDLNKTNIVRNICNKKMTVSKYTHHQNLNHYEEDGRF